MTDTAKTVISDRQPTAKHARDTQATQVGHVEHSDQPAPAAGSTPPASPIPDVVLEAELGRGGMGVVYRGRQIYLDRTVAVKLLLVQGADGQEFVRRFQREAKILASLAHPNIVSCYQAGVTAANSPYLVMEFIDGPTLKDWVAQHGRVPVRQALALTRDLAKALDHAHENGIIHRDVKPENVLLARKVTSGDQDQFPYTAKLVDLGLARPSQPAGDMNLTRQGAVLGTPTTMSPEQFDDPENVDYRADIYGLGCVLYHALVGKPAFDGKTLAAIVTAKVSGDIPQATRAKADVPLPVNQLTCDLLAPDRDQRPQSYREIIERCDFLLSGDTQQLGKQGNRSAWIGVAAAVIICGGSALAWLANRPGDHAPANPVPADSKMSPTTAYSSTTTIVPAVVRPPLSALTDADFGPAAPLWLFDQAQRLKDWTNGPDAQWVSSENRDDALTGLHGRILRDLGQLPCRISCLVHHQNGSQNADPHSDTAQIGVQLSNGGRIELTLSNLGDRTFATINSYKIDDEFPYNSQGPLMFPAGKPVPVTLTIRDDTLIAAVDGNTLSPIALPAAPTRLCLSANIKAPAEALPIEVSGLTVRRLK